ncbi:Rpn family recombination-promoting nuclease/putative transposase [Hungatella hathewayi]
MKKRKLEDLNLMDDFLFQEMVSKEGIGEEFCRILLSTILGRPIHKIKVIPQKVLLGTDTGRHGIRMDAYIEDRSGDGIEVAADIYDIEPNNTYEKETLPKRTRYYDALIDSQLLETGADYSKLRNVIIIMILPYDPFGMDRMVYTVKNHCLEEPSVPYDDSLVKLYLYTKGTVGNPGKSLCDMLKYMEKSTEDNVTDDNIAKSHNLVNKVKRDKEVGINYMKSWEREQFIRREGLNDGQERINRLNRKLIEASRTEDMIRAAKDKEFQNKLLEEFGI